MQLHARDEAKVPENGRQDGAILWDRLEHNRRVVGKRFGNSRGEEVADPAEEHVYHHRE